MKVRRNGHDPTMPSSPLFENDALLRSQWDARHGGALRLSPERQLMLAVLEQAVRDIHSGVTRRRFVSNSYWRSFNDDCASAMRWIDDVDDGSPFAFHAICDVLGFDAGRMRAELTRWVEDPTTAPHKLGSIDHTERGRLSTRLEPTLARWQGGAMHGLQPLERGLE